VYPSEPLAKIFRPWFDKLTMNGIVTGKGEMSVRPELVEGQ
jgi:hypothetical protein